MKNKNVVNVGKIMRENAVLSQGTKKQKFRVSPGAVNEVISRIVDNLEDYTIEFCWVANQDGRKTILERDIIKVFSVVDNEIL